MSELFVSIYGPLLANCLIIAIETIGLVKFFDNFLFPKRELTLREQCGLEFVICILCAFINSPCLPTFLSEILNLFLLGLAVTQLAYDCVVNGVKHFINKLFDKVKGEADE